MTDPDAELIARLRALSRQHDNPSVVTENEAADRLEELITALTDAADRMDQARLAIQYKARREYGYGDEDVRRFANWGLLDTTTIRRLLGRLTDPDAELVARLRALARAEHDDLSVGAEAADRLEALLDTLDAEAERVRELCAQVADEQTPPVRRDDFRLGTPACIARSIRRLNLSREGSTDAD